MASNGSQSLYLSRVILDHILGRTIWTPPATLYVALATQSYDPTASGSAFFEVTGGGYGRVALTNDATTWPAASGSLPSGKAAMPQITFAVPTSSWGTPVAVYLLDASTAGNVLYGGNISNTTELVPGGQPFKIYAGTLVITED